MEERSTARGERFILAYSSSHRLCHVCLLSVEPTQRAVMLIPKERNQVQIETLGEHGVTIHLDCLMAAAVQTKTLWYTRRATIGAQGPPALVLNWEEKYGVDLAFATFGDFSTPIMNEYDRKGCLWCGGRGHAPGVVLNFPVPNMQQRFRLVHITCVEEMYALVQPEDWLDRPPSDPEPLLRAFAEILSR